MSRIIEDNEINPTAYLVIGQTLVIQIPSLLHTVQPGQTLSQIANMYGLSLRQLYRNNPSLEGCSLIYPGQSLVIQYDQPKEGVLSINGYAYPYIEPSLLRKTSAYLTHVIPFTYSFTPQGELIPLDDQEVLRISRSMGAGALLHLSSFVEDEGFSDSLAHQVLSNLEVQNRLITNLEQILHQRGYNGIDVDFEFIFPEDAELYAKFIHQLAKRLNPQGLSVTVALAPKTSADQPGVLYEGHNYALLGQAANDVFLMTYEWGYTYGPPMAVAPLNGVRRVVEYALTEIPSQKLWLGIPNYGYDWTLPFVKGQSKATSISNPYAVELARKYGAEIQYDQTAQSPWFRYYDENKREHEVWFEDARSIRAKLALIPEYQLHGVGYWNLMRPFPQNWRILNALYEIRDPR